MSKERPILFSGTMVRALLDGSKTQTRRVVKPAPQMVTDNTITTWDGHPAALQYQLERMGKGCHYGQPGDRLWVRETWRGIVKTSAPWDDCTTYGVAQYVPDQAECRRIEYAATFGEGAKGWRPSIHMPRWASRITLEITRVRVERLQDISDADCVAEGCGALPSAIGCPMTSVPGETVPRTMFRALWESINGPASWAANPWVWAVEFRKLP
ncbi:hypothetical protein LJR074_002569 [Acidovorax sp. LjRoot74]|uniref:hypothetical protein n=1 Tax=Acidovorax sp. LjRoot74 TaxID=3342337 RepID=UPI003ECFFF40